jgi:hypothetical protein
VALLALNLPGLVGWIVLATAKAGSGFLAQVYAGRLLTGFSLGMASVPAAVIKLTISHLVNKLTFMGLRIASYLREPVF